MIIIYAFPRSGSSILHRSLVEALNYNSVFEPFNYIPSRINDKENFKFIQKRRFCITFSLKTTKIGNTTRRGSKSEKMELQGEQK